MSQFTDDDDEYVRRIHRAARLEKIRERVHMRVRPGAVILNTDPNVLVFSETDFEFFRECGISTKGILEESK